MLNTRRSLSSKEERRRKEKEKTNVGVIAIKNGERTDRQEPHGTRGPA